VRERSEYRFKNRFSLVQNIVVPESDDPIALSLQKCRAASVLCVAIVLATIHFDNELRFGTYKIGSVGANRNLMPKFPALQAASA
jgi:hypothetical protein